MIADFETADQLIEAIKKVKAEGYTKLDGYSPFPVAGVCDALGIGRTEISTIMFVGGLIGASSGFWMQVFTQAVNYPINVGGRPYVSWPSFIPITFELMVLTACLSGVFGLIALCGLPRLHHPLFNSERFERASIDRFILCIEATDPKYDAEASRALLSTLNPVGIEEVPQ
jgi:hypothetical protein